MSESADDVDARIWLRENGCGDVAETIEQLMIDWRRRGIRTRHNWWDVLAGGGNGRQTIVGGVAFPVLCVAQQRQGRPLTPNCLRRSPVEAAPPKREPRGGPRRAP